VSELSRDLNHVLGPLELQLQLGHLLNELKLRQSELPVAVCAECKQLQVVCLHKNMTCPRVDLGHLLKLDLCRLAVLHLANSAPNENAPERVEGDTVCCASGDGCYLR
jgi:hypothetical protein